MNSQRLLERFLRYVQIDTTARDEVDRYPSSPGQLDLGKLLAEELRVEHRRCPAGRVGNRARNGPRNHRSSCSNHRTLPPIWTPRRKRPGRVCGRR